MLQKQMLITKLWWHLLKDYTIEPTNKPYKFSLCSSNFQGFFFKWSFSFILSEFTVESSEFKRRRKVKQYKWNSWDLGSPSYCRFLQSSCFKFLPSLRRQVFDVFGVWLFALTCVYNVKFITTSKQIRICSNLLSHDQNNSEAVNCVFMTTNVTRGRDEKQPRPN